MPGSFVLTALIAVVVIIIILILRLLSQRNKIDWLERRKTEIENTLRRKEKEREQELTTFKEQLGAANLSAKNAIEALKETEVLLKEHSVHFPWLVDSFVELQELRFLRAEKFLREKKHPAPTAADKIAEMRTIARESQRNYRLTKYRIQFYEKLFPWLVEVSGEDIAALIADHASADSNQGSSPVQNELEEPARSFLSDVEWNALTNAEKFQRALDRWRDRRKHNWEIGRDYERYIGYTLEKDGYDVVYHGAIEGFADLGRDLIAKRNGEILIVQCKYWAHGALIHEKHVFQTFATALEYSIDNNFGQPIQRELFDPTIRLAKVVPKLVISCGLSPRAWKAAKILQVEINEGVPLGNYPLIKCNVAPVTGERIYHLPFDQQYDRVKIIANTDECYVATVAEAEKLGFRRAHRWRPADGK